MLIALCVPTLLSAAACPNPPSPNPARDFLYNFLIQPNAAACYAISIPTGTNSTQGGDSNALYSQIFYSVAPGYELVVFGYFPNSRFMAFSVNDSHSTALANGFFYDSQIPALYPTKMLNPFVPGNHYAKNQMYGVRISFGATANETPGCSTSDMSMPPVVDASHIHTGFSWNDDGNLPEAAFHLPLIAPPHNDGAANTGGTIIIRDYIDYGYATAGHTLPQPSVVIVRKVSNGCAIPASEASNIVRIQPKSGWLDDTQTYWHHKIYSTSTISPTYYYPFDGSFGQQVQWTRSPDWVGQNNLAAAYVSTLPPQAALNSFLSGQNVMRVQFRLPTTPNIPCAPNAFPGCTLTGNEQLRFFSLEFGNSTTLLNGMGVTNTLVALNDSQFIPDANGNVTLIVVANTQGMFPDGVTTANGYTLFNIDPYLKSGYPLNTMLIRNFIPDPSFGCSGFNVPSYTVENWLSGTNTGDFMGSYVPTVDFPAFNTEFGPAVGTGRPDTCALTPPPPTLKYTFARSPF